MPTGGEAATGTVLWALLMGVSSFVVLWLREWQSGALIGQVVLLFAVGGALAFVPALFAARILAGARGHEVRFAAGFLSFALVTIVTTALAFAFFYRLYYAQWHDDAFSRIWVLQFVFTTIGAVAQFAALGVRLFFPVGFMALIAASLWFSRAAR